ncbi:hypothetical protein RFI_37883 [Reticulomyxa filosa]|uniref:Pentatricopeptide repeat-containing protein n=1 Tax=Reticulomyxa filosa TaxID=46433 RepID=X6LDF6_RETFI|nr:hypothetical protein RFI_37883 [Reticulomyxa filosa]|eukprot:ETN99588.1 hypothetical protein RFI_37883 [Reticulomyxa filosa]
MIDKFNIKPDLITCNSLLSVCANARDIQSAELIWNKMIHDFNIDIDIISINSMLNVYAKCGEINKMMEILNYSKRSEKFISIDEITCATIMSGFLKANKMQELFDFHDNQIPKLALNNNINLHDKLIVSPTSVGYLKMMETLDENDIEKLSFYHQKYLDIFQNELYPNVKVRSTSILLRDIDRLIRSYVLLNKKSWMKAVKDVETILFYEPNYIHSLSYWQLDILNKNQMLLNFNYFSTTSTCFMLRYLMTFQRQELKRKFKNGPIKILCGKSQFSNRTRLSGWKEDCESPKKKSIEDELNKWKIKIRLEQDKESPAVWYLNEEDVQLFFETVLPCEDCLRVK